MDVDRDEVTSRLRYARIELQHMTLEDWQAHSALLKERAKQLETWSPSHDDWHSPAQWVNMIAIRLAEIAAAEDYIGPLTKIHQPSRTRARAAAIEIGALCWAMIASSFRGDLYAAGERPLNPERAPEATLYKVWFWREGRAEGEPKTVRSSEFHIVAATEAGALDYASEHIAPKLDYKVTAIEIEGAGQPAYLALHVHREHTPPALDLPGVEQPSVSSDAGRDE